MKNKKRFMKIWWKIPNLDDIPNTEARELIYRSMQIASDALYRYNGVLEEPSHFKTFWLIAEADVGLKMFNYMIGKMGDHRVKYFAELR